MGFQFRLQPLLRLRRRQEDQKKRVVGALLTQIHRHQQEALEMAEAIRAQGEQLKQQYQRHTVDLEWVAHYRRYVCHMQNAIQQRIGLVTQVQQRLHGARQEVIQAARQTKILEMLRDKQKQRYERQMQKTEARQVDEIAGQGHQRTRREAAAEDALRPGRAGGGDDAAN